MTASVFQDNVTNLPSNRSQVQVYPWNQALHPYNEMYHIRGPGNNENNIDELSR